MRLPAALLALPLLILPLLAGCGTWVNTGNPSADFSTQMRACEQQAFAKFPPSYEWLSAFSGFPWRPSCFGTPRGIICQPFRTLRDWPVAQDLNASARRWDVRECLEANGWTYVTRSQSDTAAQNAPPESTAPSPK